MISASAAENVERSGAANVLSATEASLSGSEPFKTFAKMAEDTARPTAPPEERMKFRFDVTTARCALLQWACSATCASVSSDFESSVDRLCFETRHTSVG